MRLSRPALAIFAVIGLVGTSQATVIFSDNFDAEPGGTTLNYNSFANWDVSGGTVDLIASGGYGISCVGGTGKCVDLDGSTSNPGLLSTKTTFNLAAGSYTLSFAISGNQRNTASDTVTVNLGSAYTGTFSMNGTAPFQTVTIPIMSAINAPLSFQNMGADNIGLILDDVSLSSNEAAGVPEPSTLALFAFGALGLAWLARRRRAAAAA